MKSVLRVLIALVFSVSSSLVVLAADAAEALRPSDCGRVPEEMACVPGGEFLRGSDDGQKAARPARRIWLQTFYMDLYEVTHAEYQRCVEQGKCRPAGPKYRDYDRPRQPMVGVSWYDARDYCQAQGKRLPTEAEWEKAARGADGALFPWGDAPATCERAVIRDRRGRSCGVKKRGPHPDKGRTFEVGTRPPGVYGLYDMAGNSWEWVQDWFSSSYEDCGADCEGANPRGPCGGDEICPGHRFRVVRGGSWYWRASRSRAYHRRRHFPANEPYHHFGFRCARDVDQGEGR